VLTATDQNPQKSLKRWYYPPSHCPNVSVILLSSAEFSREQNNRDDRTKRSVTNFNNSDFATSRNEAEVWPNCKKSSHTRLPSVLRSWSRFLAVSLQVMWVINPAVGCHYFPQGLQLPPQPLKAVTNFAAWWTEAQWVWTVCLRLLPDSVADAIWTRALLRLSSVR